LVHIWYTHSKDSYIKRLEGEFCRLVRYLIVTKSGYRAIKRLFPSENKGKIICKSENYEENPPFEVELEGTKLYIV
jgi:hypothetical protein